MRKFLQNEYGVGGVEFALVAPVFALTLLGIISGGTYYKTVSNMRDAIEVVGKYFLQGGTSEEMALAIAEAAWTGKPSDGTVTLNKTCVCGGVGASCGSVCSDKSIPETYWTIAATLSFKDALFIDPLLPDGVILLEREVIRVR